MRTLRRITRRHLRTKFGEFTTNERRARIVRRNAPVFGSKTKCQRDIEFLERVHLSIEPILRARAETVRPTQTCADIFHTEFSHPAHGLIEAVIFEMEPLADAELGSVLGKVSQRQLRCPIFSK